MVQVMVASSGVAKCRGPRSSLDVTWRPILIDTTDIAIATPEADFRENSKNKTIFLFYFCYFL